MIAVDTSAIVAIVFAEAERAVYRQIIQRASKALISGRRLRKPGLSYTAAGGNAASYSPKACYGSRYSRSCRRALPNWRRPMPPSWLMEREAAIRRI